MNTDYRRLEMLAKLPQDAPERCLFVEHDWSAWTPWVPIHRPIQFIVEEPPLHEIEAYRDRGCRQCGIEQRELWDHSRQTLRDPNNIEQRRGPSTPLNHLSQHA